MNYNSLVETPTGPLSTCSFQLSYNNLLAVFLTDLSPAYPTVTANGPQLVYGYDRNAFTYTNSTSGNSTISIPSVWNKAYPYIIQYKKHTTIRKYKQFRLSFFKPY